MLFSSGLFKNEVDIMGKKQRILNNEGAQRLADWLRDIHMTQAELAKEIGYTQQYVSNIMNGKRPLTLDFAQLVSDRTSQGQSQKYNMELRIRPQYLLCMDDIRTTEDFESQYIHRDQAVSDATLTLLDQSLREVCLREGMETPTLDNIPELLLLQAQLRDFSDSLMWNYVRHREHSHVWSYLDQIPSSKSEG